MGVLLFRSLLDMEALYPFQVKHLLKLLDSCILPDFAFRFVPLLRILKVLLKSGGTFRKSADMLILCV